MLNFTSSLAESVEWDGRGQKPLQLLQNTHRYSVWGELGRGIWVPAYRGDDLAEAQQVANEHDERMNVLFIDQNLLRADDKWAALEHSIHHDEDYGLR
jgi:hypothetical protein